jgi:hypothetical protein
MKRLKLVKINEKLFININLITSIYKKRDGTDGTEWCVYNGEGRFGMDLTDDEYDRLKPFLAILENPEDSILIDLMDDIDDDVDNFATDLWGGAGPDCIGKRLVTAIV